MPLATRVITLAAAACDAGVRVYIKNVDGTVHETRNNTSESVLSNAMRSQDEDMLRYSHKGNPWTPGGDSTFRCSPDSALCSVTGSDWNQSIFYQDVKGNLRERRLHGTQLRETKFVQEGCLIGTNIAAVHTPSGDRVVLFFQDEGGNISYRTATGIRKGSDSASWSKESVAIAKAAPGTGIGATASADLNEIKIYFQDEGKNIQEWKGDYSGNWAATGHVFKASHFVGDITAISWVHDSKQQIRVYYQNDEHEIIEHAFTSEKGWSAGSFKAEAMPFSDVIAFVRNLAGEGGFCLNVLWAGQDQRLHQQVYVPSRGWLEPTDVGSVRGAGEEIGSWTNAKYFSDEAPNTNQDGIEAVTVYHSKSGIAGLALKYDSRREELHGSKVGAGGTFTMQDHEDITHVWFDADEKGIRGLQFGTTKDEPTKDGVPKQRTSPWFGPQGKPDGVWTRGGYALGGFQGAVKSNILTGLAPIWTTRVRDVSTEHLEAVKKQGEALASTINTAANDLKSLEARATELKAKFDAAIKAPASDVMAKIVKTAMSVEYYYDLSVALRNAKLGADEQRTNGIKAQRGVCKVHADDVEKALGTLKENCLAGAPEIDDLVARTQNADKLIEKSQHGLETLNANTAILVKGLKSVLAQVERRIQRTDLKRLKKEEESCKKELDDAKARREAESDIRLVEDEYTIAKTKYEEADGNLRSWTEEQAKLEADLKALDTSGKDAAIALAKAKAAHGAAHQLRDASLLFNKTTDDFTSIVISKTPTVLSALSKTYKRRKQQKRRSTFVLLKVRSLCF